MGLSVGVGNAEDVIYDDTASWKEAPFFYPGVGPSVYPGTDVSPGYSGNNVTVNYSTNTDLYYVFGGASDSYSVTGNRVQILGTPAVGVPYDIYGGWGSHGPVSNNSVTISGGTIGPSARIFGGRGYQGPVSNNSVAINGGSIGSSSQIYGGYGTGVPAVTDNHVTINGGSIGSNTEIFGGWGSHGPVSNNSVTISGGSIGSNTEIFGGWGYQGPASNNSVTISGGTLNGVMISGGYVYTGAGSASHNSVSIMGGALTNLTVVGGYVAGGVATNNTVTIGGNFSHAGHSLFGGYGSPSDNFTGNTLNIKNSNLKIKSLANFQFINFYLPGGMQAGETMLTIAGVSPTQLHNGGLVASTINVGIDGGASPLKKGDTVTLIDASAGSLEANGINTTANGTGMQGVTLKYKFALAAVGNKLMATVSEKGAIVREESKALSEGFLGGATLLGQGADLASGQGMESAVRGASALTGSGAPGLAGFGGVSAGSIRYNTGSHVDMNSVSLLTGLAHGFDLAPGRLTAGAFFEWGNGSYDTYNSFANSPSISGNGNTYYLGGGLLARLDFADTGPGHFYTETSGRMGKVHNEYDNSDMKDSQGRNAHYDSASLYYGLHAGGGYIWNIMEKANLDLYAKYFWTRQEGDSVTLSSGESMRFKKVDSQRTRLGSRFTYQLNEYVSPYVGAAWEYEFAGRAGSTVNGLGVNAPKLEGGTGVGELGLNISPAPALPLTIGLGVQGYTGKREGVTGSLDLKWEF